MASLRKVKFGVVVFAFLLILVFLVASGLKKSWVYYFTVDELSARAAQVDGRKVKVSGVVVPGSIEHKGEEMDFVIEENGARLKIHYRRAVPEAFGDSIPIIAEGVYRAKDNLLVAQSILTKCPSKYEAQVKPSGEK